ncbi:hypothetical protein [Streptomyces sp. NPDC003015]
MGSITVSGVGPGRPRTRPDHVVADKGYSSRKIRATCADEASHTRSRTRRPGSGPTEPRHTRRPAARFRPMSLPPPQRRRTPFQPSQGGLVLATIRSLRCLGSLLS